MWAPNKMALRRSAVFPGSRSASSGLGSLVSLGAPALGRGPSSLQHVPEHQEMEIQPNSSTESKHIFRSEDWNSLEDAIKSLFNGDDILSTPGELYRLHQNVKNILRSKTGTFLADYYKQELLTKGMNMFTEKLKNKAGSDLMQTLEKIWTAFFADILPILEAIFYLVKPKGRLTIRTVTLTSFRDTVLLSIDLKGTLNEMENVEKSVSPNIKQMLLVLQNVNDCYPPNKNKLELESIVALVISPYLGYLGLYEGNAIPVVASDELQLASRRRSSADITGLRRISRPFSIQPLQMETLNQMFINAIRKKQEGNKPRRMK